MSAHHLAADHAVVRAVLHGRPTPRSDPIPTSDAQTYLVDVDNALTEVELGVLLGVHSLHLNEVLVGVLKDLGSTA